MKLKQFKEDWLKSIISSPGILLEKYVPTGAVLGSSMYGSANTESSGEEQFCSECGSKNSPTAKFCRDCGVNLV